MKAEPGQLTIGQALEDLAGRVHGCEAAAVVGMDGVAIDQRASARAPSIELLSAQHTTLLKDALAARAETGGGDPTELILLTDRHQFIARILGRDYFLLLVLRPDASLGQARFEARRAGLRLEEELR